MSERNDASLRGFAAGQLRVLPSRNASGRARPERSIELRRAEPSEAERFAERLETTEGQRQFMDATIAAIVGMSDKSASRALDADRRRLEQVRREERARLDERQRYERHDHDHIHARDARDDDDEHSAFWEHLAALDDGDDDDESDDDNVAWHW